MGSGLLTTCILWCAFLYFPPAQEPLLPVWGDSYHHSCPQAAVCFHPVRYARGGWVSGWEVLQQADHPWPQTQRQVGQVKIGLSCLSLRRTCSFRFMIYDVLVTGVGAACCQFPFVCSLCHLGFHQKVKTMTALTNSGILVSHYMSDLTPAEPFNGS